MTAPEQTGSDFGPGDTTIPTQTWGVWDFVLCWLAGIFASLVAVVPISVNPDLDTRLYLFAVLLPAQAGVTVAAVVRVSRVKGLGRMELDFGRLRPRMSDWPALPIGFALVWVLSIASGLVFLLGDLDETPQAIVREVEQRADVGLRLAMVAGVAVLAPLSEEILFRGLLLRALMLRTSSGWAIFVSAAAFGAAHLLDPGAWPVVPGLIALGVILGVLALRSGSLAQPIAVHAVYNLTALSLSFLG